MIQEEYINFELLDEETILQELNELDKVSTFKLKVDQGYENALTEMESLKEKMSSKDTKGLLDQCKRSITSSITSQFGLADFVVSNKDGGNVTTVQNANKKIYAKDEDAYNRSSYDRGKNSEGKSFAGGGKSSVGSEFTRGQLGDNGSLTDAYTNEPIKGSDSSPDHINSLSQFHKDGGFMLSDKRKADFATDKGNLASTDRGINKSLRDYDKKEWADRKSAGRDVTNEEHFSIDREKLNEAVDRGDETTKRHLPDNKKKLKYYATEGMKTGAVDAGKMVAYKVLGEVLREFTSGIFDVIKETFSSSKNESFKAIFTRFKERMKVSIDNLKSKWKDILKDALEGGITALFSNLLVLAINIFATTLKKIVSLIRAGFVSLVKAVKIIITRPEGTSKGDVMFEASKILVTGIIGAASLGFSAVIEKFLQAIPGLQPIMMFPVPFLSATVSDVLATTLSAIIGGVLSTIVIYYMDKLRNEGKKSKLQIQLVKQSGVIVEYSVAKSWLIVHDAHVLLEKVVIESTNTLNKTKTAISESLDTITKSEDNYQDSLDELSLLMNKLD